MTIKSLPKDAEPPYDILVCLGEDIIYDHSVVKTLINEQFITFTTVTGKEITYVLANVLWWSRG